MGSVCKAPAKCSHLTVDPSDPTGAIYSVLLYNEH